MSEVEAFVLAGGRGLRLGELTQERQKCLLPIDGKPVLGHILDTLVDAFGSVNLRIGVAYRAEDVKAYVDANKPTQISVEYVPHPLGVDVWDAFISMEKVMRGDFVCTPGDIIVAPEAYTKVYELFLKCDAEVTLALSSDVAVVDTHGVGKLRNLDLVEYSCPPPETLDLDHLRDTTIYASDKRMFALLNRFPLPGLGLCPIFEKFLEHRIPVQGVRYESPWIHIGYPEDLEKSLA